MPRIDDSFRPESPGLYYNRVLQKRTLEPAKMYGSGVHFTCKESGYYYNPQSGMVHPGDNPNKEDLMGPWDDQMEKDNEEQKERLKQKKLKKELQAKHHKSVLEKVAQEWHLKTDYIPLKLHNQPIVSPETGNQAFWEESSSPVPTPVYPAPSTIHETPGYVTTYLDFFIFEQHNQNLASHVIVEDYDHQTDKVKLKVPVGQGMWKSVI